MLTLGLTFLVGVTGSASLAGMHRNAFPPLQEAPAPERLAAGAHVEPVRVDMSRGELLLTAKVQHPKGKACIDAWGERLEAFVGCETHGGKPSSAREHFVFLVEADLEQVYRGLVELGARTKLHCSPEMARQLAGREFLQGDPVLISVSWQEGERRVEHAYEDFVREKVVIDGREVEKPWTPHLVFHGGGVIHRGAMGCIATPSACPGGIIADNRSPILDPKPQVRFDLEQLPPPGTRVEVRIRTLGRSAPSEPAHASE